MPFPNGQMLSARAKLRRPLPRADLVTRQRLLSRLDRGSEQRLVILSAPAGFGKTTLVAQWAASLDQPAAWMTLDASDNDVSEFLGTVVAAIQMLFPGACQDTLTLLKGPQTPGTKYSLATLSDDILACPRDFVLILDDYHLIHTPEIHTLVTGLVEQLPERLHLMLVSRVDPIVPLSRLRVRRQVEEIRVRELCFDLDETRAFFQQTARLDLDADTLALLHKRTEGWIAGLQLAALSLRERSDPAGYVQSFAGNNNQYVMDFLLGEVLSRQSEQTQQFLLQTSILDRFCAELCLELTGLGDLGAVEFTLLEMEHANLFLIPLDDQGKWYRYHNLFRDLLQHRLYIQDSPATARALHLRASRWYARQDHVEEAVHHALAADAVAEACQLVGERMNSALDREAWFELDHWLKMLPAEEIKRRPQLLIASAWTRHFRGAFSAIPLLLERASSLLEEQEQDFDTPTRQMLWAHIEALEGELSLYGSKPAASLEAAERGMGRVTTEYPFLYGWHRMLLAMSVAALGDNMLVLRRLEEQMGETSLSPTIRTRLMLGLLQSVREQGDLTYMEQQARVLLRVAKEADLATAEAWGHLALGTVYYERRELTGAVHHFAAVQGFRNRTTFFVARDAAFAQALALQVQGRSAEANGVIQDILEYGIEVPSVELIDLCRSMQARLALLQGDLNSAVNWAETANTAPNERMMFFFEVPRLTLARVLIAKGDKASLTQALDILAERLNLARVTAQKRRFLEIYTLQALALDGLGKRDAALDLLDRALALGEQGEWTSVFLEPGPSMARLLHALAKTGRHPLYIQRILYHFKPAEAAPFARARGQHPKELIAPLTDRELDVLDLLQNRLTYKEIGSQLVISPLTVRKHVQNIYQKLNVTSRREALERANALGLVE